MLSVFELPQNAGLKKRDLHTTSCNANMYRLIASTLRREQPLSRVVGLKATEKKKEDSLSKSKQYCKWSFIRVSCCDAMTKVIVAIHAPCIVPRRTACPKTSSRVSTGAVLCTAPLNDSEAIGKKKQTGRRSKRHCIVLYCIPRRSLSGLRCRPADQTP